VGAWTTTIGETVTAYKPLLVGEKWKAHDIKTASAIVKIRQMIKDMPQLMSKSSFIGF
jgi:hypothetical protein